MTAPIKKIAIIAGSGELPVLLTIEAKKQGYYTYAIALNNDAKIRLADLCDKLDSFYPGQVASILKAVQKEGINKIIFIGKIHKGDLLKKFYKLDFIAIKYLSKLLNLNDDSIHGAVTKFLQEYDMEILPQTQFLSHLYQEKEILSKRKPTDDERVDIEYGIDIARKVASLDIGQTVIVKNKMIIAIEGIDGTDETIKRGCQLSKSSVVMAKAARINQDQRFDIPTIGAQTVEVLGKNGGGVLAFESGKVLVADKEKTVELANKYNICLIAV